MRNLSLTGLLCAVVLASLSGCAIPAGAGSMTIRPGDLQTLTSERLPRAGSIALEVQDVSGGQRTDPMATPEISAADFAQALTQSLKLVGLHSGPEMQPLPLRADLMRVEHPPGDQDLPTYLTVRYRIYPIDGGEPLFDRTVRAGHMVPMRATPSLKGRQRAALEGAARKNIATFIGDVSEFGPGS